MGSQGVPTKRLVDLFSELEVEGTSGEAFPGKKDYLPAKVYEEHLNERSVRAELNIHPTDCSKETTVLIQFITKEAPKIFLALIDTGGGTNVREELEQFQHLTFDDRNLPFEMEVLRSNFQWGSNRRKNVYASQWKYLAPIFSKDKFRWTLHPSQPLPFTTSGPRHRGGTAFVYQVKVHPAHLEDPPLDVSQFNVSRIETRVSY